MSQLKLYNSLTRKTEEFKPLDENHVRLYACGPTVYNYAHIGNARMAVVFDVLARVLKRLYPKVTYVSNITDVDDKIMQASKDTGEEISVITQKYERIYNEDMAALGCAQPDVQPRATEHIEDMIGLITLLIAKGHAYAQDGHVCFHVPSFDAYGGLSGRSRDEQIAGARVEIAPYKKDAADFVLWKPSSGDEVGWESPWGFGRPGWHIECSAMAERHLGLPFDIHGGGADLKFPHHENEIAQSCCAHGHTSDLSAFAKMWVHNGFVTVEGEKMSKSLGNVTLVHDLLEQGHNGAVIRLALLSAHYRKPLDWSAQALHQAQKLYEKICAACVKLDGVEAEESDAENPVLTALSDDLNTPAAFAKINALLSDIHSANEKDLPPLKYILHNAITVVGLRWQDCVEDGRVGASEDADIPAEVQKLAEERGLARAAKDWARADAIRDELAALGYAVEDGADGAVIKKI